ncbi:MAG: hypothetical protein BroJett029_04920 [Alphaproteobacteria bacterium]|nr:MAG: hypothetical protein BroJett029_04920 [Alphaproteobacteria bacterium]
MTSTVQTVRPNSHNTIPAARRLTIKQILSTRWARSRLREEVQQLGPAQVFRCTGDGKVDIDEPPGDPWVLAIGALDAKRAKRARGAGDLSMKCGPGAQRL